MAYKLKIPNEEYRILLNNCGAEKYEHFIYDEDVAKRIVDALSTLLCLRSEDN